MEYSEHALCHGNQENTKRSHLPQSNRAIDKSRNLIPIGASTSNNIILKRLSRVEESWHFQHIQIITTDLKDSKSLGGFYI
jgi:hypothetical protein